MWRSRLWRSRLNCEATTSSTSQSVPTTLPAPAIRNERTRSKVAAPGDDRSAVPQPASTTRGSFLRVRSATSLAHNTPSAAEGDGASNIPVPAPPALPAMAWVSNSTSHGFRFRSSRKRSTVASSPDRMTMPASAAFACIAARRAAARRGNGKRSLRNAGSAIHSAGPLATAASGALASGETESAMIRRTSVASDLLVLSNRRPKYGTSSRMPSGTITRSRTASGGRRRRSAKSRSERDSTKCVVPISACSSSARAPSICRVSSACFTFVRRNLTLPCEIVHDRISSPTRETTSMAPRATLDASSAGAATAISTFLAEKRFRSRSLVSLVRRLASSRVQSWSGEAPCSHCSVSASLIAAFKLAS